MIIWRADGGGESAMVIDCHRQGTIVLFICLNNDNYQNPGSGRDVDPNSW